MKIQLKLLQGASKDQKTLEHLLRLILSDAERAEITKRITVMKLLLEGDLPQRQIAGRVRVGLATVERCAWALKSVTDDKVKKMIINMT